MRESRHTVVVFLFCFGVECRAGAYKKEFPPWDTGTPSTATLGPFVFPILLPLTNHGCGPSRYMSMRIATSDINRRDSSVCPAIGELSADFEIRYEVYDSNANGLGAMEGLLTLQKRLAAMGIKLKFLLGPNNSDSVKALSYYLAAQQIPFISWAATNSRLSDKATYPNFFRIVPPDSFTMHVLALFVVHLEINEVNALYFDADFQKGQAEDFRFSAVELGIKVNMYKIPSSEAGGGVVSTENRAKMLQSLRSVQMSGIRAVAGFAINEEAWQLWQAANSFGMVHAHGWIWLGGDGISGSQMRGQLNRVEVFEGSIFLEAFPVKDRFSTFISRWEKDMEATETPEFRNMSICHDNASCVSRADFIGWKQGQHDRELQCQAYTAFAYDAVVTMAVVLDRLIAAKGGQLDEFTSSDWMKELQSLTDSKKQFSCLTGQITLNENQERLLPVAVHNWKKELFQAPVVATWTTDKGFRWKVNETLVWPSGSSAKITDEKHPPLVPSGRSPLSEGATPHSRMEAKAFMKGKHFFAYLVMDPPFVARSGSSYNGFLIDLMAELQKQGDFEYTLLDTRQTYKEVFDEVVSGRAKETEECKRSSCIPVTLAAHWLTSERALRTAVSSSYMEGGLSMLVLKKKKEKDFGEMILDVFSPFQREVWLSLLLLVMVISLCWCLIDRHYDREKRGFGQYLHNSLMIVMGQGSTLSPNASSGRTIHVILAAVCVICITSYTAALTVQLETSQWTQVRSFTELSDQGLTACVPGGGTLEAHLKKLQPQVKVQRVETYAAGVEAVRNGLCGGVVFDAPINKWTASGDADCSLVEAQGTTLFELPYVFFFPPDDLAAQQAKKSLDFFLMTLRRDGRISSLFTEHFGDQLECAQRTSETSSSISFDKMSGAVVGTLTLLGVAGVLFVFEGRVLRAYQTTTVSGKLKKLDRKASSVMHVVAGDSDASYVDAVVNSVSGRINTSPTFSTVSGRLNTAPQSPPGGTQNTIRDKSEEDIWQAHEEDPQEREEDILQECEDGNLARAIKGPLTL